MSDETLRATRENAERLLRGLRDAAAQTRMDRDRMPFFVRPMAKRGFARRTGRSTEEWEELATDLIGRVQAARAEITRATFLAVEPRLEERLQSLIEHYRTAPERAAAFMRDESAMAVVKERSRARETAVRELLELLRRLPA